MTIKETSAYIKGLMEGANLDTTTPEGKVIAALVELDVCNAYIEEIDEDLGAVEEVVYDDEDCDCCDCCGDDDDEDCDCCDDDCDCCDCCGDDDEDDDEEFYCAMCPNCGGKVYFDDTVNPEDVICPACQKPLLEDEDESEDL